MHLFKIVMAAAFALLPLTAAQAQEVAAVPTAPLAAQVIEGPGPFERLLENRLHQIEAELSTAHGLDLVDRQALNAERAWLFNQLTQVNRGPEFTN